MTYLAEPFWENGASVFWVVVAVGGAIAWIVGAWKGSDD